MPKQYDTEVVAGMELNIAGALLADAEEVFPQIQGIISARDFQTEMARTVFQVIGKQLKERKPVDDPYIIVHRASEMKLLLDEEYCRKALTRTHTFTNIVEYAKAVHENAISLAEDKVGLRILSGDLSTSEAIAELQNLMKATGSTVKSPQEAADEMMDFINAGVQGKQKPFIPTGIDSLDRILSGGLVSGGLITLAARPGTGKTTAGISIAENVAMRGTPVLYISLEMTTQQIWTCRIANYSGVNRSEIYTGNYSGTDEEKEAKLAKVSNAVSDLYSVPFYVRDIPSTVDDIEREARSHDHIGLIVVDHIGLIKPPSGSGRGRYEVMTDIAHQLKQLALSLQIPILALCQLNRGSLDRKDRRPTMADLRDSGAIEEDSDSVILLFRDSEGNQNADVQKIMFIVDKNRHGMTGIVDLHFIGSMSRICM